MGGYTDEIVINMMYDLINSLSMQGNLTMTRKLFLLIFMLIPLTGALVTGTPTPVLLAMGVLILFGLTVASLREQA